MRKQLMIGAMAVLLAAPASPAFAQAAVYQEFSASQVSTTFTDYSGGSPKPVYWATLSQDQIKALLSYNSESAFVEQLSASGRFTMAPVTIGVKGATYRVTYYFIKARPEPCSPNPKHGTVYSGVGVRVVADIQDLSGGVQLTNLLAIAASAEASRVKGRLQISAIGLSSGPGSPSITPYLSTSSSGLTADGLRKAVESFGVVKAVTDAKDIVLTPYDLIIQAEDIAGCRAHRAAAP